MKQVSSVPAQLPLDQATSERDLILTIQVRLLFKHCMNFGHLVFSFQSRLITFGPGTFYCLVHLPQSSALPNRQSVGNSRQNSSTSEGRCPILDKAISIQYIIHSGDKKNPKLSYAVISSISFSQPLLEAFSPAPQSFLVF